MSKFSIAPKEPQPSFLHKLQLIVNGLAVGVVILFAALLGYARLQDLQFFSVQSGSMEPTFSKGDLVIANHASDPKVGDIVTFINPADKRQTLTHRVTAVNQQTRTVQTKGDANRLPDTPVPMNHILGTTVYIAPFAGAVVDTVLHPVGLVLLIYIPALMVIMSELRRLAAYYKTQKVYRLARYQPLATPRPSMGRTFKTGTALAIILPLLIALPVHGLLSSSAGIIHSTLATAEVPDSYRVCQFPVNNPLASYSIEDALVPKQQLAPFTLTEPILPGTYRITAESSDPHMARPNSPTQPDERWFVYLYEQTSVQPDYVTGVTDDIPDAIDQVTTVLNDRITFANAVTGIRYAHNAVQTGLEKVQFNNRTFDSLTEAEKRLVLWNSVHPGCITLERISPADVRPN